MLKSWEDRLDKDKVCSQKFDVLVQSLDSKSVHKVFKANVQLGLDKIVWSYHKNLKSYCKIWYGQR